MKKRFCCHGDCHQGRDCPRDLSTPGDTRLGLVIVIAVSGIAWAAGFALLAWWRS